MTEKIPVLDNMPGMAESEIDFAATVRGHIVRAQDSGYDAAQGVWNGCVKCRPQMIFRAADTNDVIAAVNRARETGVALAVRGAGHHPAGFGTVEDGLVLDMGGLKRIEVNTAARTVTVDAGVTAGEFMGALHANGLISTVGSHPTVGMTGMTLGGGMGLLMGKYGLVCDNLQSAQMVTADGVLRTVSATGNPDLFWAIRGGGGNFGVVTQMTFGVHTMTPVLGGFIAHPVERAGAALRFFRDFSATAPDELGLGAAILTTPEGHTVCAFMVCYSGNLDAGAKVLAPLREFGSPVMDRVQPMPYIGLLNFFDGHDPAGAQYSYSMRGLKNLSDECLDTIAQYGAAKTSPETTIVLYQLHGKARRVPLEATAYPLREVDNFLGVYAGWGNDDPLMHEAWCREFRAAIAPCTTGTSYLNLMSEVSDDEVRATYGRNYARLQNVKAQYDPTNLFRRCANITPATTTA